jgi:hypothetical protein
MFAWLLLYFVISLVHKTMSVRLVANRLMIPVSDVQKISSGIIGSPQGHSYMCWSWCTCTRVGKKFFAIMSKIQLMHHPVPCKMHPGDFKFNGQRASYTLVNHGRCQSSSAPGWPILTKMPISSVLFLPLIFFVAECTSITDWFFLWLF